MKRTYQIILGVAIVLLVAGGALVLLLKDAKQEQQEEVLPPPPSSEEIIITPDVVAPLTAEKPDLNRPIKVTANIPEGVKENAITRIQELTEELKKDDDLYSSWLDLAVFRKIIGDYDAVEKIWLYAADKWPTDATAYNNLADFYLAIRKNNTLAEKYLLLAIQKNPSQVLYYENAYSFYRFVKKDLAKAKQILEEGIAKNPGNTESLKALLNDLSGAL